MSLPFFLVSIFFGAWFLFSVINNLPDSLRRKGLLLCPGFLAGFLPVWHFFAPIPGITDYYLLYRGEKKNGDVTTWRVLSEICVQRKWYNFFWSPEKLSSKILTDLCSEIIRLSNDLQNKKMFQNIKISMPYLILLKKISEIDTKCEYGYDQKKVQFAIASSSNIIAPKLLFSSDMHKV